MADLAAAISTFRALVQNLRDAFPDADEQTIADTAEGESTLDAAILATLRAAIEREAIGKALGGLIDDMASRKRRLDEGAQAMRGAALQAMQEVGLSKLAAPDMSVSVGRSKPKVQIVNPDMLPDTVCTLVRTPSKTKIAEAFALGQDVRGAMMGNPQPFLSIHRK